MSLATCFLACSSPWRPQAGRSPLLPLENNMHVLLQLREAPTLWEMESGRERVQLNPVPSPTTAAGGSAFKGEGSGSVRSARHYLKWRPSARMVSCCTPPIRLKKMALCPPSTVGRGVGVRPGTRWPRVGRGAQRPGGFGRRGVRGAGGGGSPVNTDSRTP